MPEGPECRQYGELLAKRVSGRQLVDVKILSGRYQDKPPSGIESFKAQLPVEIVGAGVHGKFLYWILKDEYSLWNTLGMTGNWSLKPMKHSRVEFVLNNGSIFFNDMRNFGTLKFVRGKFQLLEKLKSLGPDMLAVDVDDELFIKRLRFCDNLQVTEALMNQSVVAGVGNYIKSDSLWLARINPHRHVKDVSDKELENLNRAIKQIMRESYDKGVKTLSLSEERQEYSGKFLVYNQKADPDGNEVVRELTADQRTTHWCPAVQK